jgi:hypothetical protein
MSGGLKTIHLSENSSIARAVNALRASLASIKEAIDDGVTQTIDMVTDIYDDGGTIKYHYREVTITDGIVTSIGDEETGTVS